MSLKKQLLMAAAEQARKEGISPEEVIDRGRRHMMRAGGLGAAAGAIPALLMMRDAPAGEATDHDFGGPLSRSCVP